MKPPCHGRMGARKPLSGPLGRDIRSMDVPLLAAPSPASADRPRHRVRFAARERHRRHHDVLRERRSASTAGCSSSTALLATSKTHCRRTWRRSRRARRALARRRRGSRSGSRSASVRCDRGYGHRAAVYSPLGSLVQIPPERMSRKRTFAWSMEMISMVPDPREPPPQEQSSGAGEFGWPVSLM
jgi:hypothetical protein